MADHVHGIIRDMLRRLRPVGLDELGLTAALEHVVASWNARNPEIRARLSIATDVDSMREQQNIAIYRLVQEALNNVSRHARARKVTIDLAEAGKTGGKGGVVVTICDDGTGARRVQRRRRRPGPHRHARAHRGALRQPRDRARGRPGIPHHRDDTARRRGARRMSASAERITVLLVDDHAVVREGYRRLLERDSGIHVAGEAGNAADAYSEFCRLDPDVVVMDISLPDTSGIEAMRHMLARGSRREDADVQHARGGDLRFARVPGRRARLHHEGERPEVLHRGGACRRAGPALPEPRHGAGARAARRWTEEKAASPRCPTASSR